MKQGKDRPAGQTYVYASTGYSDVEKSFNAGKDAAEKSIASMEKRYNLEEVKPDALNLTMVFSSKHYEVEQMRDELEEMLRGVKEITRNCPLVGCTTAGNITNEGVHNNAVSVMTLSSDLMIAGTGVGEDIIKDAAGAGKKAVTEALEKMRRPKGKNTPSIDQEILSHFFSNPASAIRFNPFSVIMFPQGRVKSEFILYDEEIIRGMRRKVGYHVPIIGASSANGSRMARSFQFCDGKVYINSVVCTVLYSLVNQGYSASQPFVPMRIEKRPRVTKLKEHYQPLLPEGNRRGYTILELDDVPAAKKYFELVGDKIKEKNYKEWLKEVGDKSLSLLKEGNLLYHPFGLSDSEGNIWMKKISSIRKDDSVELTSLIPDDSVLAIMELRSGGDVIELVHETAKEAIQGATHSANITNPDEIAVVLVFDCDARYHMIKRQDPELELKAIKKIAGKDTPIIGFYGYGEQLSALNFPNERLENSCTVMILSQKLAGEALKEKH